MRFDRKARKMQPVSTHWADIAATKIIREQGDKEIYTLASGITPSGNVHFGNFREVITVDLVARALRKLGKKVRFIYSWDNFDTFRKVPADLPDPKAFEKYLRESIARIPDPWGQAASYSEGRCKIFEKELDIVGIAPEFIYQESEYAKGSYAENMIFALENKAKIKDILDQHRTEPLPDNWVPTVVYCSKCKKDDMHTQEYKGNGNYSYHCSHCDNKETFAIKDSSNLKLIWRVDWPMRWAYEKVDFEPGGKDHSSEGGSFDTGKKIVKELWNREPPVYLQYDFVKIKGGGGKMSSSKGDLYTLSDLETVYEPEILRWIFVSQRPNHDFAIALDEDVFKIYEEFDRLESKYFELRDQPSLDNKDKTSLRVYELSSVAEDIKNAPVKKRASFRMLSNRLQICNGNLKRAFEKYYAEEGHDWSVFEPRAVRAWYWVTHHATGDFRYTLREGALDFVFSEEQEKAVKLCYDWVAKTDLESLDSKVINELLWEHVVNQVSCESKDVFQALYQCLVGKDKGPRLPGFIKELGSDTVLSLLKL